jgi:hypothetical protein
MEYFLQRESPSGSSTKSTTFIGSLMAKVSYADIQFVSSILARIKLTGNRGKEALIAKFR